MGKFQKLNYSEIAKTYDSARRIPRENLQKWLGIISDKIGRKEKLDFLDLGCGTGRFSIPVATTLHHAVTAADISEAMISIAKQKPGAEAVKWDIQAATSLTYPDETFDVVFTSHLLHHLPVPADVIAECYRVLRRGGVYLNRYGAMEHIEKDPEHVFFPGLLEIDRPRTPTIGQVETWLKVAGFTDIESMTLLQRTHVSPKERLERVMLKKSSALALLDEHSLGDGIEAMKQRMCNTPRDPWFLFDEITLTYARKDH